MENNKKVVKEFWNEASCGERLYLKGDEKDDFLNHAKIRYELEPYIFDFAEFPKYRGKKVLEIGVGLGADHQQFAENGADLYGVDLTERAIANTSKRFKELGLKSTLSVEDAENLPFEDNCFDLVYSAVVAA